MTNCDCCLSPQEARIANSVDTRAGRERIYEILDSFHMTTPFIDIERARYFTESMKATEGQPMVLRWAKALMNCAEKMTVYITPGSLIAGRAGKLGRYGILYPEIDGDFYSILGELDKREKSPFKITPEEVDIVVNEIAPFWKGKTYHEHLNGAMPDDLRGVTYDDDMGLKSKFVVSETSSYRSALQWVHDYDKVLKRGFNDIKREAEEHLAELDDQSPVQMWEKRPFYEAMVIICDAITLWARRHADLARDLAAKETDKIRKAELLAMADRCERMPAEPAKDFRDAIQSQWFVQMFSRIEQKASAIISNGRMDQYLFPYYEQDLEAGTLTREQAKELLEMMWVEMAQFIDLYINPTGNEFNEGYAHWEAVTIGGQTPQGEDATNDLSYLFLESKREFPLNYPDLAARIHSCSPERFLAEIAETIKDGSGFPKLINDEEVIPLYTAKGAPYDQAMDYSVSGCTEARMPNIETYTSGCVYVNFATAVEMTMHNGRMLKYGDEVIGLETGDVTEMKTWDEFYDAYIKQHNNLLVKAFRQQYIVDSLRPEHFATPLASVLHDLCMKEGLDLQNQFIPGGLEYSYFEFLGYGTVVDCLSAIKKVVFEDKKLTMEEVLKAITANFDGYEDIREILRSAPSYGNNDPYADAIAKEIDAVCQRYAAKYSKERGVNLDVRYVPITSHVPFGKVVSALPNGREAWTALSDGSSASHGADHMGPTAVLMSNYHSKNRGMKNRASRLLNVKLSPKVVEGEAGTQKIVDMIRSWCDLHLWHIQFNIINKQTLLAAQKDPDKYRSLLVRIAGYSAYFCDLSRDLQNDIINRTEHEHM
ncbi:glycyl radical protein [Pseudodesulfovibrio thermohalotolerans]|jgi:formate C-acetyltransferase|uniref:(2S)-3-sulfopropanediol dehydratase n=1 Tax=Pseudodesulfovibrio thermohalotolerans TaxID=2880651 RepID=UPI002442B70A|nr:glycyl radical protein [Pseudodesulfovibrio thermohalotolerans]WFS62804.1 glycyl radical protein [Pseudodesulfovibrio thermohalotolerans]